MKITFFTIVFIVLNAQAMERKNTDLSFEENFNNAIVAKNNNTQKISSTLKDEYDSDDEDFKKQFEESQKYLAAFKHLYLPKKNTEQSNSESTKNAQ